MKILKRIREIITRKKEANKPEAALIASFFYETYQSDE